MIFGLGDYANAGSVNPDRKRNRFCREKEKSSGTILLPKGIREQLSMKVEIRWKVCTRIASEFARSR